MAAEGGEVLLQRLLIADVGQHRVAPGQLRDAAAGQKQPGSRHQGGQPQAFEGHGFAAGVGAGDGDHPQGRLNLQAHRHHSTAALLALLPNQQRVAQLFELPALVAQRWFDSAQPGPIPRSRQAQIQLGEAVLHGEQALFFFGYRSAELKQHPPFFFEFLRFEFSNAVAQAHHRLGLNEQGVAGGGAVVHLALQ